MATKYERLQKLKAAFNAGRKARVEDPSATNPYPVPANLLSMQLSQHDAWEEGFTSNCSFKSFTEDTNLHV